MFGEYNSIFPELQSSGIGPAISTESGPQYEYPGATFSENVAQTRLLTILPGRKQEPVRCTLRSVRLEGIESYEALSYAWGNPTFTRVILINEARFRVGENLFQALNSVRLPSSERVMWVDAICINQTDMNERNLQVRQMSNIYSRAQLVVVWLGLETASSKAAFEFLRMTAAFNPPSREELINDRGWDAFIELCERDYWKRVWIVQEICLAARIVIMCGSNQVPWKHISNLRKSILNLRAWERISSLEKEYLQSLPARIDQQRETRLKSGCMLWGLLENFQDSLCQDIHDKIYGLLGLSNDCSQSILVDYSKSVNELYKDVMWFYHEKFRKDSNSSLPQGPQLMKLSEFLQNLLAYHPQSSDDIWLLESEERNSQGPSRQLVAMEKEISQFVNISACGVLVVRRFLSPGETGDISEVVDFLDGSKPYSDIGKWRTVIDPILSGVYAITNSPAYATSHGAICRRKDSLEKINYPSAFIADPPDGPADNPAFNQTERLFEWKDSQKYAIGIAPSGTQTGDVVLLFLESKTALILRPPLTGGTPSTVHDGYEVISSGRYTLVGRAAMDLSNEGVMDFVRQYRSQIRLDKRVETTPSLVQVGGRSYPAISRAHIVADPQKLWPVTLSIDILSLRLLTRVQSTLLTLWPLRNRGDIKPPSKVLAEGNSILPERSLVTLSWRTRPANYTPNFGYAGIINLGATGYISCTLQLLYMLKPFRMNIMREAAQPQSQIMKALQDIFLGLENSSLPVSPLALTRSIGWVNRPNDLYDFLVLLLKKLQDTEAGLEAFKILMELFSGKLGLNSSKETPFWNITFDPTLKRLEEALRSFCTINKVQNFCHLPSVLLLKGNFTPYNPALRSFQLYRGSFEYPSVLQLSDILDIDAKYHSDSTYQLRGVVVLKEEYPTSKYLIYLKPQRETFWVRFFNDAVAYTQEREVFDDNFGSDQRGAGTTFSVPILLAYVRETMINHVLG